MSGRVRTALYALVGIAAIGTAAVVLVLSAGSGSRQDAQVGAAIATGPPVEARATVNPRSYLFGDTVTARLDVLVDSRRVDPRSVRFETDFGLFERAAAPKLTRQDGGGLTVLTYTVPLRCLELACIPRDGAGRRQFPRAGVRYDLRGSGAGDLVVVWPALLVYSRVPSKLLTRVTPNVVPPWRGEVAALPRPTYAISPGLLAGLLLGGAGVLVLAGLGLVRPLLRRSRPAASPGPSLSPLARAFLVLEGDGESDDSVEARRRALELVATTVGRYGRRELASTIRRLAWSKQAPAVDDTKVVARDARRVVGGGGGNGNAA